MCFLLYVNDANVHKFEIKKQVKIKFFNIFLIIYNIDVQLFKNYIKK